MSPSPPPTNRPKPREPAVYDSLALGEQQWVDAEDALTTRSAQVQWTKNGKERVQGVQDKVYFKSMKSMTEIVASWVSRYHNNKMKIVGSIHNTTGHSAGPTGVHQDGEHITLSWGNKKSHAYVIYPEDDKVPLGNTDVERDLRQRSNFVIAEVYFTQAPRYELITEETTKWGFTSSAAGVEIFLYFLTPETREILSNLEHIFTYNQTTGKVSLRLMNDPEKVLHPFEAPVELPKKRFLTAAPGSGSGAASSSQAAKPKKSAGGEQNKPGTGNAGGSKWTGPVVHKRPEGATKNPMTLEDGKKWWVNKDNKKLALYKPTP